MVARIGTTLTELARDRDALLASLRAAAPHAPLHAGSAPVGAHVPAPPPVPATRSPTGAGTPGFPAAPPVGGAPPPPPAPPPLPSLPPPTPRPVRRLSPQQVLLGLGALLVVAAGITFVAVGWTRFGIVFQAGAMLTATALAAGFSSWSARRGLRATEEALAAAAAALLVIDLFAARALGLFALEDVPLRHWSAICCTVVVLVALSLGRLTRTTAMWPLTALLAAQPLPFLLLGDELLTGPAGVAAALALAAADLAAAQRLRAPLVPVARRLAQLAGGAGVLGGLAVSVWAGPGDSWTSTGVLALAGAAAVAHARRSPGAAPGLPPWTVPGAVGAVVGLALAGSLQHAGDVGWWIAAALGLSLLTVAALLGERPEPVAGAVAAGSALVLAHAALLADAERWAELAVVALAATVPAVVAAVRVPALRCPAATAALLAPAAAVLLARADAVFAATTAGLLLALLAAGAFAVATLRRGLPEEGVCAAVGAAVGLAAGATSGDVEAWGQVGLQLGIVGIAAGSYAVVAGRRWVGVLAVADLVVASWIAVGGAGVETPEAYTLPAALGLLVVALPALRSGAPSWAAEGAAAGVALVPSALVVVAEPTALRLVLVIAAACALVVAGTLLHRQAPFVVGAGVLLLVTVGRLAPFAPLLPRWLTLGTAGILLLVLGGTYERRRQQAREAVAWVGQMR
ncbi:SCO7613 C-terminal domain-containing membrane protein [Blastococcus aurantiacus]|uniref:SCO7613 C-terminal domain-containing membrane protein n=1 Tax=Blastococcus aurantiacus TaxID=1550231 RepID=UPI002101C03A|nr:hypothetical protein [Blastococcus aurantiacus]